MLQKIILKIHSNFVQRIEYYSTDKKDNFCVTGRCLVFAKACKQYDLFFAAPCWQYKRNTLLRMRSAEMRKRRILNRIKPRSPKVSSEGIFDSCSYEKRLFSTLTEVGLVSKNIFFISHAILKINR